LGLAAGGCFGAENLKPAITNAADATQRAVVLANQAIAGRTSRRFPNQSGTAILTGQNWVWRGRIGYGKGDLEVVVTLRADGQVVDTQVAEWMSIPQSNFRLQR
jgi:hypothetical protein